MTPDRAMATAADYADALLVTRRSKNLIVLLLLLMVLVQIAIFCVARFTDYIIPASSSSTTTQPARWYDWFQYLCGISIFLGVALSLLLAMVLYLIVQIMLVGRLIGVARATSAFIWALLVILLMFPWQAFLSNATFSAPEFKIPGVLYTWDELLQWARFPTQDMQFATLKWARFVGFPALAVILLLVIQVKSNRGLSQALGDSSADNTLPMV